jgi:2-methylcitrate dehydratase PrpD
MSGTGERVGAAGILGGAAARTSYRAAPEPVRHRVVDVFVDTLAVMALGSDRTEHARLRTMMAAGGGRSTVIGQSRPASAAVAVMLNGTTPTVYQIDEGHRQSRGHPGIHVVPAVLALAEETGAGAEALFSALLAGYEVAARLGQSLNSVKPDIHPHGNWGSIGAAVGAAHLLTQGDESVIAAAIDAAAAVTLYPDRAATTRGAGVHHLYAGLGAQLGLVAGYASACGMSSVPGCLENFMGPRSGRSFDPNALVSGIDPATGGWSRHEITANYFKFLPACGHTHTAINALLEARKRTGFGVGDVERIEVRAFRAAANLSATRVENDLAARYSIPYVLAAALLDDGFGLDALRDERMASDRLHELAGRVHVQHEPDFDGGYPVKGRPVVVEVRLRDGRTLREDCALSFGDVERPATREALHDKARRLLSHRFGAPAAEEVLSAALGLESGGELTRLSESLRAAAGQRSGAARMDAT